MRAIITLALALITFTSANAQMQDTTKAPLLPYQKYQNLPAFNILMTDSIMFNTFNIPKGKPTVFILFSTDCDHCQHFAERMCRGIDSLKNANIYMLTFAELADIRNFSEKYGVSKCSNIHIGRDADNFFPLYYGVSYVPYIVIYDKHKRFLQVFEGNTVKELYKALRTKRDDD